MWALENDTPFAAERTWVRDKDGAEVWLVAVKGTFRINPDGSTALAEDQVEICRAPVYRGEPGKSSLLYESDLVHTKRTTDVLLHGHAYAPRGEPAPRVEVLLKVDTVRKKLRVTGNRSWKKRFPDLALTEPEPFVRMPITYERAFGGTDQKSDDLHRHGRERRNPVGTGFAVERSHLAGQQAPNVEDSQDWLTSLVSRQHPAGLGPIARDWSPRVEWAGTYGEAWETQRKPLLPADFDERFYQCAPVDQQAPRFLRGGEQVELQNLSPGGLLRFRLPKVVLGFTTRIAGDYAHHRADLHTVILEPDHPRVLMVWHTALPCHHDVYTLRWTRVFLKERVARIAGGANR